ncbi:DoxX family protein [Cellulomonas carbonis T26]|uniref:DoxX family protein n=2 Tax=Cellulomonas carbonis TaxID=1386092 RepID=A0A0A0BW58_9CELL|nr:DoxX family protein [Cellulomonas carbonis T26]
MDRTIGQRCPTDVEQEAAMSTTTARKGTSTSSTTVFQEQVVTRAGARYALAFGRIVIGWVFLWAFVDKLFGLGYATPAERAWLNGGTPAQGYIGGAEGPFAGFFQSTFQNAFGDVLFMAGLLGIGLAMMLGIGLKVAAVTGTLLMVFMWMTQIPWVLGGTNPITTSHWVEAALLIIAAATLAGDTAGLGRQWGRVVGNSWLR